MSVQYPIQVATAFKMSSHVADVNCNLKDPLIWRKKYLTLIACEVYYSEQIINPLDVQIQLTTQLFIHTHTERGVWGCSNTPLWVKKKLSFFWGGGGGASMLVREVGDVFWIKFFSVSPHLLDNINSELCIFGPVQNYFKITLGVKQYSLVTCRNQDHWRLFAYKRFVIILID